MKLLDITRANKDKNKLKGYKWKKENTKNILNLDRRISREEED